MVKRVDPARAACEVANLAELDPPALRQRWRKLFGSEPSAHLGRGLLLMAVAYRIQEQALGGLKPRHAKLLDRIADEAHAGAPATPAGRFKPGTRLLREWHGITHEVEIGESAILYRGARYRSLSEVARVITGTRWSGPLFFGLKERRA